MAAIRLTCPVSGTVIEYGKSPDGWWRRRWIGDLKGNGVVETVEDYGSEASMSREVEALAEEGWSVERR